jgi:hypothetical protein
MSAFAAAAAAAIERAAACTASATGESTAWKTCAIRSEGTAAAAAVAGGASGSASEAWRPGAGTTVPAGSGTAAGAVYAARARLT